MDMPLILLLALVLALGYLGGLIANKIGLPKVSGYVLVGMLLSPTVTGVVSHAAIKSSAVIVDFALAMVAYMLGGSLRMAIMKKSSRDILCVTVGQGAGAFVFVAVGTLIIMHFFSLWPARGDLITLALIFGAISLSTAPAATLATVHECKARGGFTSTLLAIVALDDAVGLMVFAIVVAFLCNDVLGSGSVVTGLMEPVLNILFSSGLGAFVGLVLIWALKNLQKKESLIIMTVASFCFTFGMSRYFSLEPLFATMVLGVTVANIYPGQEPFVFLEKNYEEVVFAVFFVLAGAHLDIMLLKDLFPLAVAFVILRISGKWIGSYAGGTVSGAESNIRRYMGFALAPQAGIAIGLAIYLERIPELEQFSAMVINVIVAKTAINEVVGPWLLKTVLKKVKEARRQ
jgi:Kef-type K+ transport system membrane component KefB